MLSSDSQLPLSASLIATRVELSQVSESRGDNKLIPGSHISALNSSFMLAFASTARVQRFVRLRGRNTANSRKSQRGCLRERATEWRQSLAPGERAQRA